METSLVVIKGRSPLTKQFCNFFVPRRPSALFVLLTVADDVDLEGVRDLAAVVLGPVGLLAQVQLRHDGRTDRRGRHRKAARPQPTASISLSTSAQVAPPHLRQLHRHPSATAAAADRFCSFLPATATGFPILQKAPRAL